MSAANSQEYREPPTVTLILTGTTLTGVLSVQSNFGSQGILDDHHDQVKP